MLSPYLHFNQAWMFPSASFLDPLVLRPWAPTLFATLGSCYGVGSGDEYLSSSGVGIEKRRERRGGGIRYGRENGPGGEEQNQ